MLKQSCFDCNESNILNQDNICFKCCLNSVKVRTCKCKNGNICDTCSNIIKVLDEFLKEE